MPVDRRGFLTWSGLAVLTGAGVGSGAMAGCSHTRPNPGKADYTLRIDRGQIEVASDRTVSTTTYNNQFPGPLLRFTEGKQATVEVHNNTDTPEQLHWHGQRLPVDIDGAAEEGTPFIPAHGTRRITFTPGPTGFRLYHTHLTPGPDLTGGQYTGQIGLVYIEPKQYPGAFDQEIFLTLKEFEPILNQNEEMPADFLVGEEVAELKDRGEAAMTASLTRGEPHGYEVGYRTFTINGRALGHGDPIRVRFGERVLLHVLNGSATETRSLALPGHTFTVVALDGNPVPNPVAVPTLWLGTAERVCAIVEMTNPGVWVLGDTSDDDREHGMGIVVEYAGRTGDPQWVAPPPFRWDYRLFTTADQPAPAPDQVIDMLIDKRNAAQKGFNVWTINNTPFSMADKQPVYDITLGKRYRLHLRNATDDVHPMHLHRHTFEITNVAGTPTAGVRKDVAMLGGYQSMDIDFLADQPGLSLLHCHSQLHMDFGFMALLHAT
ncbi:multicopper oxidase family protein [Nocardia sp. NPDC004278]